MNTPHGYDEIIKAFGNPTDPAHPTKANPAWEQANIKLIKPPAGWQLYYQDDAGLVKISGIRIHVLLADSFTAVLTEIWEHAKAQLPANATTAQIQQWLHAKRVDQTGGGYNYRPNTSNPKVLSMHCWGIAIDWDPDHNPRGTAATTLEPWWYQIWANHGWSNGKHFHTPDPMHVQFATGA